MIFTETWLNSVLDATVELTDRALQTQERSSDTAKSRGGGLSMYLNNNWCTQSHCSCHLESLLVLCRSFHSGGCQHHPDANVSLALFHLHQIISKQQKNYPD